MLTPIDPTPLLTHLERGTLIAHDWGDGYERACWLTAIVPGIDEARDCPSSVMPTWLAYLVPWMDDNLAGTAAWKPTVTRFAEVLRGLYRLDDEALAGCERDVKIAIIEEVLMHVTVDEVGAPAVCEGVIAALRTGMGLAATAAAHHAAAVTASYAALIAADAATAAANAAARAAAAASGALLYTDARAAAATRISDRILTILEAAIAATETP